MEVFKKSRRMVKLPVRKEEGGWEDIVKEMSVGFKEIMR